MKGYNEPKFPIKAPVVNVPEGGLFLPFGACIQGPVLIKNDYTGILSYFDSSQVIQFLANVHIYFDEDSILHTDPEVTILGTDYYWGLG